MENMLSICIHITAFVDIKTQILFTKIVSMQKDNCNMFDFSI